MAHFAKVENGIVTEVIVIDNKNEIDGEAFINKLFKTSDTWIQTSYNTRGNEHILGGTALRKNYAQVSGTYDKKANAFIGIKPYPSWVLNQTTFLWEAPIPVPNSEKSYRWYEPTTSWVELTKEENTGE